MVAVAVAAAVVVDFVDAAAAVAWIIVARVGVAVRLEVWPSACAVAGQVIASSASVLLSSRDRGPGVWCRV